MAVHRHPALDEDRDEEVGIFGVAGQRPEIFGATADYFNPSCK
jgi:hypothetical protein